jgi:t-SNARE complex subunit (syntaxin)
VYPELVVRDQKGRIDGVRYDELTPILLNEQQRQAAALRRVEQQVADLDDLKQEMRTALQTRKAQVVAQR